MNKITHQAIVYIGEVTEVYNKWDSGEITRYKSISVEKNGFTYYQETYHEEISFIPDNLKWIDVNANSQD